MINEVFNIFHAIQSENFAILSPRILPFMPSHDKRRKLISPTLLSFNNDGFLPLPQILKSTQTDKREQEAWLDMLLDISGTSKKLEVLVKKLDPTIKYYEEQVYPAIRKMEILEGRYELMKNELSDEQRYNIANNGYAFLEPDQLRLIYGKTGLLNISSVEKCSKESLEAKLEDDIRQLAHFEKNFDHKRFKRDDDDDDDNGNNNGNTTMPWNENNSNSTEPEGPGGEGEEQEEMWPPLRVLRPWAFINRFNESVVLEAVILSPHAFFGEIMNPEFMNMDLLSPRAFQPAILSPAALLSRILSPLAFGAEVLSPRAFVAYILSPEAFTAEVLSPQFFEAHILSPEAFAVQILSPNIIGPRIGSPEANSILILSPNILSPRILSRERMMIEILSPHVLGGEETEEEEESNLHSESELPEAHKYHNHSRGRFGPPGTEHEHAKPVSFFPFG
uniref:Uncharacterized protein n=1 Tax=Panagrolaimus sp. PS1159 TaxID=55785 RepID=A0AC35FPY4_9BILA